MEHPGKFIKTWLEGHNFTASQLACDLRINKKYICDVLNCKAALNLEFIEEFSFFSDIPVEKLYTLQADYNKFKKTQKNKIKKIAKIL